MTILNIYTHSVPGNHIRECVVSTKIQACFHARVSTPNDQNSLVFVLRTGFIIASMRNRSTKHVHSGYFRNDRLCVFSSGHNKPTRNVLEVSGSNRPETGQMVKMGGLDGLVEPGVNVEMGSVGVEVGDELVFGGVFWEIGREIH